MSTIDSAHLRRASPASSNWRRPRCTQTTSPVVAGAAAAAESSSTADDSGSGAPAKKPSSYRERLAAYGVAGVVAYGILNTFYYFTAFALAWFYLQPGGPPSAGMGWTGAAKAAGAVLAGTWVGSQVTKAFRAAGAVALAPVVDAVLERVARRLGGQQEGEDGKASKGRAVALVVGACLLTWAALFFVVLASVA